MELSKLKFFKVNTPDFEGVIATYTLNSAIALT